jgi:acrylyl-CoA reductase (NADPH) / 3-hydroxypropionyl-CoA dehydratase / 3-hydroxypropionyl-CoA synthetase
MRFSSAYCASWNGQAAARRASAPWKRCASGLEDRDYCRIAREAALFADAIVDPEGGKTGIRQFIDKVSARHCRCAAMACGSR